MQNFILVESKIFPVVRQRPLFIWTSPSLKYFERMNSRHPQPVIEVEIPLIEKVSFTGRDGDLPHQPRTTFYPPKWTGAWPKIIGDCRDKHMSNILSPKWFGKGAKGSIILDSLSPCANSSRAVLVDGKVYKDDTPFWLSLVKSKEFYPIVYGK
jgi:hypothetical protein